MKNGIFLFFLCASFRAVHQQTIMRCHFRAKMENGEVRAVIKYLVLKKLTAKEIFEDLTKTLGTNAPSYTMVKKWAAEFKRGRISIEDPRSGRPKNPKTEDLPELVMEIIMADRRTTQRQIADTLKISQSSVHEIIRDTLKMTKVSARWVPRLLTEKQKIERARSARSNLAIFNADPEGFLNRFVTMDETWVHHYEPETKEQSKQWKHATSPTPTKAKSQPSAGKVMASIFWDSEGVLLVDYLEKGKTINGKYYANLLRQLRAKILELRPGKITKVVMFHQDNAPAHTSGIAMQTIKDCGFELLDHPPYSPDLAPSDFYLFPKMKNELRGKHFSDNDDVIDAVNDFLGGQSKSFYKEGIMKLQERWSKCVSMKGSYVEK